MPDPYGYSFGVRIWTCSIIRCGGRGSRTFRRAVPAANDLDRIYDDLGPLAGGHIVAVSMLDPLNPNEKADDAIPPTGGYGLTQVLLAGVIWQWLR